MCRKQNFEKVLLLQLKTVELPCSTEGCRIRAFYSNLLWCWNDSKTSINCSGHPWRFVFHIFLPYSQSTVYCHKLPSRGADGKNVLQQKEKKVIICLYILVKTSSALPKYIRVNLACVKTPLPQKQIGERCVCVMQMLIVLLFPWNMGERLWLAAIVDAVT